MSGMLSFLGGSAKHTPTVPSRKLLVVDFIEARDLYDVDKVKLRITVSLYE